MCNVRMELICHASHLFWLIKHVIMFSNVPDLTQLSSGWLLAGDEFVKCSFHFSTVSA